MQHRQTEGLQVFPAHPGEDLQQYPGQVQDGAEQHLERGVQGRKEQLCGDSHQAVLYRGKSAPDHDENSDDADHVQATGACEGREVPTLQQKREREEAKDKADAAKNKNTPGREKDEL